MARRKKNSVKPGRSAIGRDKAVTLRPGTVENPDWDPSKEGDPGFPRYITREKNTKESAIETLYARNFIATSQKRAADKFRELWEAAGGKTGSLDYSMDRVDGGRGDPVTGRLIAVQELKRVRNLIGLRGYETLEKVCGEGRSLGELSPHKRERLTMADNLRADLDDAATMWRMQTKQRRGKAA